MNILTPEFDEKDHRYTYGGVVYPSVTSILSAVGITGKPSGIPAAVWEAAGQRGSYAHQACELDDAGTLDEEKLDDQLKGYVQAWRECKLKEGLIVVPEWTERRMVSPALGYAGTIDRVVKYKDSDEEIALDLKTGVLKPSCGVQLAAYEMMRGNFGAGDGKSLRLGVKLGKDGSYKVVKYWGKEDYQVWMACLKVYNFNRTGE